jgi:2'-5' RNA ligase
MSGSTKRKYFIAILLPEELANRVIEVQEKLSSAYGTVGADRSPPHITLHRPFEWKMEKERALKKSLSSFSFQQKFQVRLNGFGFFEPRVAFIRVEPNVTLSGLYAGLTSFAAEKLGLLNEMEDERGFLPHVTLASRKLKKVFPEIREEYADMPFLYEFRCEKFSLLKLEKKWMSIADFQLGNELE